MSAQLELKEVCFSYHKTPVLRSISFSLNRGEVLAIIGPSGGGKSTLLRAISLIQPPSSGEILFRGKAVFSATESVPNTVVRDYRHHVGLVFQQLYLWPHLTALENITLPLVRGRGLSENDARLKAESLLARLSVDGLSNRRPAELSVGQQQRCAIARTLALDPDILLLDEITSSLDPELVDSILALIRDIAAEPDRTLIVVTHHMEFAVQVGSRIGYLEDGRFVKFGAPGELAAGGFAFCTP